jgi:hypothetical protein
MCHHHAPWQSIDIPGLLAMVDSLNEHLPDATNTTGSSETSTIVAKALGNVSAGGPVWLISWGMALNAIGGFIFWNFLIDAKLTIPLVLVGIAAVFHLAAGLWLKSMAHALDSIILSLDPKYANEPKIRWEFWLLFWSAIASSIICFLCMLAQLPRTWTWNRRTRVRQTKVDAPQAVNEPPPAYDPPAYESVNFESHDEFEQNH